ncbi:hypothetical protein K440DRAFT_611862 [Wilcoxina mikolae CBS 423.85]|nr:hypothetical protein K440DRAFT_611862 [Wilcoxina mikolae CBS 423.85]
MQFSMTFAVAALAAMASALPTVSSIEKRNVQYVAKRTGDIGQDKGLMHQCFNGLNDGNWHSQYQCGGFYWQMQGQNYNSPGDCWASGQLQFKTGIDNNVYDQQSDDYEEFAHCWMQMWSVTQG